MANNGQKWSNFLQYSIILPTHHFKEALEKKKVKINSPPPPKGLDTKEVTFYFYILCVISNGACKMQLPVPTTHRNSFNIDK